MSPLLKNFIIYSFNCSTFFRFPLSSFTLEFEKKPFFHLLYQIYRLVLFLLIDEWYYHKFLKMAGNSDDHEAFPFQNNCFLKKFLLVRLTLSVLEGLLSVNLEFCCIIITFKKF